MNLDINLSNQRDSYTKDDLGYQSSSNAKYFIIICHAKKKAIPFVYKCNYC